MTPCKNAHELRCQLVEKIEKKAGPLEDWFRRQEQLSPPPPYTSIDLRDSGFKMSPVDSNIFPAGFNNICVDDWSLAGQMFHKALSRENHGKAPKRVMIVPENHTSNLHYFENLWALQQILTLSGFEVILGHQVPEWKPDLGKGCTSVKTANDRTLVMERIVREGNLLRTERSLLEESDLILLNNDLSQGVPPWLEGLKQIVTPQPSLGWYRRQKSQHLSHYSALAREFAEIIAVDPWIFTTHFAAVDQLDFDSGLGIDRLASTVDEIIGKIQTDYNKRNIKAEPHVFIKHNSGTYGRSIMTVRSGAELLQLNRREKNKMNVGKGGVHVNSVLVMEGIPTDLRSDQDETAEPVIYLAGADPVGGFLRVHAERDAWSNLNSPGARFKTLCFANLFRSPNRDNVVLERLYGSLARLSALANGREQREQL
jgi:glutamate--cysteine ligase